MDENKILAAIAATHAELNGLQSEVAGMRSEVTEVRSGVAGVQSEFAGLRSEFAGLRSEFTGLRSDLAELRSELRSALEEVRSEIASLHAEVADLRAKANDFRVVVMERFERIEDRLTAMRADIEVDMQSSSTAFDRVKAYRKEMDGLTGIVTAMQRQIMRMRTDIDDLQKRAS